MTEDAGDEATATVDRRKKNPRSEEIDISFIDGRIEGWAFGVPECFRDALDILYTERVDKERTKAARLKNPKVKSIKRWVWTRGKSPQFDFIAGSIFYEPSHIRRYSWSALLAELRNCLQVKEAVADSTTPGWVEYELTRYRNGEAAGTSKHRCSQAEFAQILEHGIGGDKP